MDDSISKRERAESLVVVLESKIQTNEEVLKDFLGILQEAGVGHTYVVIMENELRNPQRSSGLTFREATHVAEAKEKEESSSKGSEYTDSSERQEAELTLQLEP